MNNGIASNDTQRAFMLVLDVEWIKADEYNVLIQCTHHIQDNCYNRHSAGFFNIKLCNEIDWRWR